MTVAMQFVYNVHCIMMSMYSDFACLSSFSEIKCIKVTVADIEHAKNVSLSKGDGTSIGSEVSVISPWMYFQCLH